MLDANGAPMRAPLTAHIVVGDAAAAIDFYRKAFGAEELFRILWPDTDAIVHAELMVNGAKIMMAQESEAWGCMGPQTLGGSPVTLHLFMDEPAAVDALAKQAEDAGCTVQMAPHDAFWGDRYAQLSDPFGHIWAMSAFQRDVSMEEMESAMRAMASQSMETAS